MNGDRIMTDMEKEYIEKLFDEKIRNIEKLFEEKTKHINEIMCSIRQNVSDFINATTKNISKMNEEIDNLNDKTNNNKNKITELEGKIKTMQEVKKAENGTREKGIKMWQFWLAFSIPTLFALISTIISIIVIINNLP